MERVDSHLDRLVLCDDPHDLPIVRRLCDTPERPTARRAYPDRHGMPVAAPAAHIRERDPGSGRVTRPARPAKLVVRKPGLVHPLIEEPAEVAPAHPLCR